MHHHTIQIN